MLAKSQGFDMKTVRGFIVKVTIFFKAKSRTLNISIKLPGLGGGGIICT